MTPNHTHIVPDIRMLLKLTELIAPFPADSDPSQLKIINIIRQLISQDILRIEASVTAYHTCHQILEQWFKKDQLTQADKQSRVENLAQIVRIHAEAELDYELLFQKANELMNKSYGLCFDDVLNFLFALEIGAHIILTQNKQLIENFIKTNQIIDANLEIYDLDSFSKWINEKEIETNIITVLTPDRDAITLPIGSTPVDFAYHIHTKIGNSYQTAIVNGQEVSHDYILQNNDQVKIKINQATGDPQLYWLQSVKTNLAKRHIKKWQKSQNIFKGKNLLIRKFGKRFLLTGDTYKTIAHQLNCNSLQQFWERLGKGDIDINKINKLVNNNGINKLEEYYMIGQESQNSYPQLPIDGSSCKHYKIAQCCRPFPKDNHSIIGIIEQTNNQSHLIVHDANCEILERIDPEEQQVIKWNCEHCVVSLQITMKDRENMLHNVIECISKEVRYNIRRVNPKTIKNSLSMPEKVSVSKINLLISSKAELDAVITQLNSSSDILRPIVIKEITPGLSKYDSD